MTTVGDPATQQRSPWERYDPTVGAPAEALAHFANKERFAPGTRYFHRRVGDGTLRAIVADEPAGWHLSISFVDHKGNPRRYPKWDEISHARYELLPTDITVAMILPPPEQFVAIHATTFHLHEIGADEAPSNPPIP